MVIQRKDTFKVPFSTRTVTFTRTIKPGSKSRFRRVDTGEDGKAWNEYDVEVRAITPNTLGLTHIAYYDRIYRSPGHQRVVKSPEDRREFVYEEEDIERVTSTKDWTLGEPGVVLVKK